MKKICIILLVAIACAACAKKSGTDSAATNSSSGTLTESKSAESAGKKDMSGTWIVTERERTWELVITPSGANTWTTTPTLISNSEKGGLIDYGPPGSKGDTLIIVGDGPGKFKVRYAKAENFHSADFWNGTGTYDDNTFNFAGYYIGKRKS